MIEIFFLKLIVFYSTKITNFNFFVKNSNILFHISFNIIRKKSVIGNLCICQKIFCDICLGV